jgi:hypothetical protein
MQGSSRAGTSGDMIQGNPFLGVVKTFTLQVEVIQSIIQSQSGAYG